MLAKLLEDDSGQDIVEYGLLIALLVIGSVAIFPQIFTTMQSAWSDWGANVYGLWEPGPPGAP